ncbi:hypothetical protein [Terriglobus sp. TAA 43]|uniref:hypothetical protein n=1 Tax=Terriglobus sp. TAA 43 TaxID=278961 RepID=UPI0006468F8F|nr:hypothetical protein [Terriglobus sp. TAA 43]
MAKVIGSLTVALTFAAGLIVQSGRKDVSGPVHRETASAAHTKEVTKGEGPWVASCRYWAAIEGGQAGGHLQQTNTNATAKTLTGCDSKDDTMGWNIPSDVAPSKPAADQHPVDITSMIAVVPDPIHSGLALDFDRTLESVLLAAADNHYLSSYYWLPWQQRATPTTSDSAADPPPGNPERERQPGLVILRYVSEPQPSPAPASNDDKSHTDDANLARSNYSSVSYRKVVYLFLVAETPSLGVNGEQLQNALRYEQYLQNCYDAHLSIHPVNEKMDVKHKVTPSPSCRGGLPHQASTANYKSLNKRSEPSNRAKIGSAAEPVSSDHVLSVIGPSYSGTATSLYAGLSAKLESLGNPRLSITGVTSTAIASHELDPFASGDYRSFGENTGFEEDRFLEALVHSGFDLSRVAILSESGTVYGSTTEDTSNSSSSKGACLPRSRGCYREGDEPLNDAPKILSIRFPRELSILRNASANDAKSSSSAPTPYLGLSLKGDAADDTVERFSKTQTPLSIEAQLMAIANQLKRARTQYVLISASNVLDVLFLAEFLHRACPDARLVMSSGGDLLFEREGENAPYIGSISISPYLLSSLDFTRHSRWMHSDYHSEAIYNAATYAFHGATSNAEIALSGYSKRSTPTMQTEHSERQIPLWASVVGADGYYPLAVLNWCSSDDVSLLPSISTDNAASKFTLCSETNALQGRDKVESQSSNVSVQDSINANSGIGPSLPWQILVGILCFICLTHVLALMSADLWSPFTRDFAMDQNDLPHRRAVYLNIGASVLASTAFVTAYPLLCVDRYFNLPGASYWAAVGLLFSAAIVVASTAWKTRRYFYHSHCKPYCFFNCVSVIALFGIIASWARICRSDTLYGYPAFSGLYHSVRCLQPFSGVSPLCPLVLVLSAWYLWALYQIARLRFSQIHRPRLPRRDNAVASRNEPFPLFVPDNALEECDPPRSCCLYADITSLLITRELIVRAVREVTRKQGAIQEHDDAKPYRWVDAILAVVYVALFCCCLSLFRIHSLDAFVFHPLLAKWGPTMYEALLKALFFPLLMVALAGWIRTLCIWAALNRGLLEPLERMPIRFAFDRYKSGGWMSMLRQKGLHIRWRDMSRSTEAIRQIVHHSTLTEYPTLYLDLSTKYRNIDSEIRMLMASIRAGKGATMHETVASTSVANKSAPCPSHDLWDMPEDNKDICSIFRIESDYADFGTSLINLYLAGKWEERINPPEQKPAAAEDKKTSDATPSTTPPSLEHLAEDFIVIRYVALIRSVLLNMRYQMLTVGTTFVLALVAWNSYPFEPHAFMDWAFTLLLGALSVGFISVFAQMHRSAILSRITDTTPNELGWEFYIRLITFGAVPVLTWLAYEFPQIGGSIYRLLQPSLQGIK